MPARRAPWVGAIPPRPSRRNGISRTAPGPADKPALSPGGRNREDRARRRAQPSTRAATASSFAISAGSRAPGAVINA